MGRSVARLYVALACASAALCSCGAGEAIRPKDQTYAGAAGVETLQGGATCHDVGSEGSPLIVDWKPEERSDLEVAMRQGVAVVHYDCNAFRLLGDCHPDGIYGFIGVTRKEQVISLANADEAKANLPLNGGTLGGGISTGSTLDIALLMIGKKSTTFADLTRDDLVGKCDGATHFIRAATLGAFSMKTGTAGEVKTAAAIFGVGASAGSSSTKSVLNSDGDSSACNQADVDAPKPPSQCGALLRIQLEAIADAKSTDKVASAAPTGGGGASDAKDHPKAPPSDVSCPAGLVAIQGKCAAPVANMAHECKYGDPKDCAAQCDAGELTSCARLGFMYTDGEGYLKYDEAKAFALFQKSCNGGNQAGCSGLGDAYFLGEGVEASDANNGKAIKLYQGACAAGYADGCENLAGFYNGKWTEYGIPNDPTVGMKLHVRACDGGSSDACITLAEDYEDGKGGVKANLATALVYYDRACDGGNWRSCDDLGDRYLKGDGAPAVDKGKAALYYQRGCNLGGSSSCINLGDAYSKGDGVPPDPAKAAALYQRGCKLVRRFPGASQSWGPPVCKTIH
jgi:TPR repeat protein